ncbi:MAG: hypothetical protein KDD43_09755 [Bdellovibrionales bacterium]|nr:hypothetical protein [Bdellovibrionales bacterium]
MKTDELLRVLFIRDLSTGARLESENTQGGFPVVGFEENHLLVTLPASLAEIGKRVHVELELKKDFLKVAIPIKGEVVNLRQDPDHPDECFAELAIFQKDDNHWQEVHETFAKLQLELIELFRRMRE